MLTALILVCSLATISNDCTRDNALDVVYVSAAFDSPAACMMRAQQLDRARSVEERSFQGHLRARLDQPSRQSRDRPRELGALIYPTVPQDRSNGRKSGTFEGFNYSPANKSSGITWSEETFPKYIRAPMQEMPGTRMAFVGIKNDKDIADLWAYLKQSGADGAKK